MSNINIGIRVIKTYQFPSQVHPSKDLCLNQSGDTDSYKVFYTSFTSLSLSVRV